MYRRAQKRQTCKKHPNQNNCVYLYTQFRAALVFSPSYKKPKINSKRRLLYGFYSFIYRSYHLRDLHNFLKVQHDLELSKLQGLVVY